MTTISSSLPVSLFSDQVKQEQFYIDGDLQPSGESEVKPKEPLPLFIDGDLQDFDGNGESCSDSDDCDEELTDDLTVWATWLLDACKDHVTGDRYFHNYTCDYLDEATDLTIHLSALVTRLGTVVVKFTCDKEDAGTWETVCRFVTAAGITNKLINWGLVGADDTQDLTDALDDKHRK